MCRGAERFSSIEKVTGYEYAIQFTVMETMIPKCRLMVFYFNGNEFVGDSHVFDVSPSGGEKVSIFEYECLFCLLSTANLNTYHGNLHLLFFQEFQSQRYWIFFQIFGKYVTECNAFLIFPVLGQDEFQKHSIKARWWCRTSFGSNSRLKICHFGSWLKHSSDGRDKRH